jgi:Uma2 family endonuclease
VTWQTYEALLRDVTNRRIRLTYDRGRLEIMTPLFRHESYAGALGELVRALAEELNVPIKSGWSTTFRRQDLERGLEPDRCFYVRHVSAIVGKLEIDLSRDPPPDLAIEIDIMSSSLNRLGIYAALGVPEAWRFDGERFEVLRRRDATGYDRCEASPTFPSLPVPDVAALLHEVVAMDDLSQVRRLREWVRERAAAGPR